MFTFDVLKILVKWNELNNLLLNLVLCIETFKCENSVNNGVMSKKLVSRDPSGIWWLNWILIEILFLTFDFLNHSSFLFKIFYEGFLYMPKIYKLTIKKNHLQTLGFISMNKFASHNDFQMLIQSGVYSNAWRQNFLSTNNCYLHILIFLWWTFFFLQKYQIHMFTLNLSIKNHQSKDTRFSRTNFKFFLIKQIVLSKILTYSWAILLLRFVFCFSFENSVFFLNNYLW